VNLKRAVILIIALIVTALILFNDLPIQFPWMFNMVMLYVKICVVLAVAIAAFIFVGGKKKPAETDGSKNEASDRDDSN